MHKRQLLSWLVGIVGFAASVLLAGQIDNLKAKRIAEGISSKLSAIAPDAKFLATNGLINIRTTSQKFKTFNRDRLGNVSGPSHEAEGPDAKGFCFGVRFRNRKYNEPMARTAAPSFDRDPDSKVPDANFYYTSALLEYPKEGFYVVIDIQYGASADEKALWKIFELIKASVTEAVGSK